MGCIGHCGCLGVVEGTELVVRSTAYSRYSIFTALLVGQIAAGEFISKVYEFAICVLGFDINDYLDFLDVFQKLSEGVFRSSL